MTLLSPLTWLLKLSNAACYGYFEATATWTGGKSKEKLNPAKDRTSDP